MNFRSLIFLIIVIISNFGCKDDVSSIGLPLIPPGDRLSVDSIDTGILNFPQTSSFYYDKIDLGASPRVIMGKNDEYTSYILLRFFLSLPDSVLTPLISDSINVLSAWVEIKPNYTFGDKTEEFNFEVRKVNGFWLPPDFDIDSLNNLDYDSTDIGTDKSISDTLISFKLPVDTVTEWLKNKIDDVNFKNEGMLFKPTAATARFIGFRALSNFGIGEYPVLYLEIEKPGEFTDTLLNEPNSDVHIVEGNVPVSAKSNILLQGGLSTKGKLYFDISNIPKNIIINRADLELTIDAEESRFASEISDSIRVYVFEDSTENALSETAPGALLIRDSGKYKGDITRILQLWLDGAENEGVRLNLTDEARTLARVALSGSADPDPIKRPKIKIYFTSLGK